MVTIVTRTSYITMVTVTPDPYRGGHARLWDSVEGGRPGSGSAGTVRLCIEAGQAVAVLGL